MKDIYYLTSTGERINLTGSPYRMLSDTDLFNYAWEPITEGDTYQRIVAMKKGMVSPQFSIRVIGNGEQDLLDKVENLTNKFDADVYKGEMGRLYVGEYYRECYIQSASMSKTWRKASTVIGFIAISDNADWVRWGDYVWDNQAGSSLVNNIADDVWIDVDNNSSTLDIVQNIDNTIQLFWINLNVGGAMEINLGEVMEVEGINGLIIPKSGSLSVTEIEIAIAETKDNYTVIDTITQENMYGDDIEWNDNTLRTFKYLRIRQAGQKPVFTINCTNFGIYPTDSGFNYVIPKEHRVLDGVIERTGNLYYVEGESGTITFSKPFLRLSRVYMTIMGGGSSYDGFSVDYRNYGEAWTTLIDHQSNVDWNGEEYCDEVRITLPNGTSYFQNFAIMGIERELITNNSYADSDFILRIFGEDANPTLTIGDNTYGADVEIAEGEYLEIDSKNKTVRLYDEESGEYENKFANRIDSTFEKIPTGESEVVWLRWKTIELSLEEGRSQPQWN